MRPKYLIWLLVPFAATVAWWLLRQDHISTDPASPAPAPPAMIAQQPTMRASTPLPPPALGPSMDRLVQMLGSRLAQDREAAARFLASVPYQQRHNLRTLKETADETIAAQLQAHIDEIELQLATNPPPISLHVREATLEDVVRALNLEMGTNMDCFRSGPPAYALDADNMPFWEVIAALHKQRRFRIAPFVRLQFSDMDAYPDMNMDCYTIQGPFFCFSQVSPLPETRPPSLMLRYSVIADPRMDIARATITNVAGPPASPRFIRDSAGNSFELHNGLERPEAKSGKSGNQQLRWSNPGARIDYLKIHAAFTSHMAGEDALIPAFILKESWEGRVGEAAVSIPRITRADRRVAFECRIAPAELMPRIMIVTSSEQSDWAYVLQGSNGTGWVSFSDTLFNLNPQAPLRLKLARSVHEFTADFELRNIALPTKP